MSLKTNQEVFLCRGSEATWHTCWVPLMHPVLRCSKTIQLRWFCFVYKKILPTGQYPEEPPEPRDCCTTPEQRPALTRGWLGWMLPAEVMSGLKRTQVPSSSSSTTSTPLAGTSCASCSPSCRDKAQLGNRTWLLQAQPQGTHRHSFLSKSVLAPPCGVGKMTEFDRSFKSWKFGISCKCYKSEFSAKLSLGVPWLLHKGSNQPCAQLCQHRLLELTQELEKAAVCSRIHRHRPQSIWLI